MGSSIAQVGQSTQPQGQPMGKGSPRIGSQSSLDQNAINTDPQGFQQWQQAQQPQATQGKGGNVTFPGQGGQPRMGQPNMYPNTVGQWDNASIQPQQSRNRGGKGKG